jgi:flagellar motor switch protein FliN/FliY
MPVTVSFGTARVSLKDVAKLSTGSIIELNRSLSEPVQLVVNNCSIAQADVVVVDGKFGIRIKEIMSRHDRLRSLT